MQPIVALVGRDKVGTSTLAKMTKLHELELLLFCFTVQESYLQ